ncbi:MAG: GxGYxYP family putative glycoside hydrolase [Muribaculaceae bacterium]
MKNRFLILFTLLSCFCAITCKSVIKSEYILQTPSAFKEIYSINIQNLTEGERLAVLSLQGIVNRKYAKIYTFVNQDEWVKSLYKSDGYINHDSLFTSIYPLLSIYKNEIKGVVVYDEKLPFTINLATNIAGVENRIIVSRDILDDIKRVIGDVDVFDLKDLNLKNQKEAFIWYVKNIFSLQNHSMLAISKGGVFMYDVYRDYIVEFKIPVFWLPGSADKDYDVQYDLMIRDWLSSLPVNIPVLGFCAGVEDGKDIGYKEFDGVKLFGLYGKFTLVNTWVGNYSFHSGVTIEDKEYKQTLPRAKKKLKFDSSKKYVALIMNESGDAPCYFLYSGMYPRQWDDSERGEVAISYGITPSLRFLAPGVFANLYNTQSKNDFFFCSISGAGYCYPFEGYGSKTNSRGYCLKKYFSDITSVNMRKMDLDMLGIYTHTGSGWTIDDEKIVKDYIVPMPGLKSIISGMHRTKYTAGNAHNIIDGVSVHHTVTFWSSSDFKWDDKSLDEKAVDHLEKEIKTYGADGQFIQAMFYSWHYGPRRLNILKKRLEKEGYEFVTLNEFDELWRSTQ